MFRNKRKEIKHGELPIKKTVNTVPFESTQMKYNGVAIYRNRKIQFLIRAKMVISVAGDVINAVCDPRMLSGDPKPDDGITVKLSVRRRRLNNLYQFPIGMLECRLSHREAHFILVDRSMFPLPMCATFKVSIIGYSVGTTVSHGISPHSFGHRDPSSCAAQHWPWCGH